MTPPRVTVRGMGVGGRFPGRRGRRPLRFARERAAAGACPSSGPAGPPSPKGEGKGCCWRRGRRPLRFAREWAATGTCPSSGPAGPPSPKGEGKGCCWRQREAAAGWGHPALRMGIWKRPRGLCGHPFPGRRTVGAGHARPGGWREHPSMVRSVGRGLDPSAGGNPGMGGDGSLPLIRPCGATFPRGGRQGLLLAAAQASAGRRGRRPLRLAREWAAPTPHPAHISTGV